MKNPDNMKIGDVIGFSGRCLRSALINLGTGGIPFWGISHVGIVGFCKGTPSIQLFESVEDSGVVGSSLQQRLNEYEGRAWLYRLYRPLYLHEVMRMSRHISSMLGRQYDEPGAIRSGGFLFSLLEAMFRQQDLSSFFCSEFVAHQLAHIGLFETTNASRWSPNRLLRALRRLGIVRCPERIK